MLHRLVSRLRRRSAPPAPSGVIRYLETRQPHAYAPYDAGLYVALLRQIRAAPDIELAAFSRARRSEEGRPRLYLRHDVDMPACVENLPILLDIDLAEDISSPVYVRTDGTDYRPEAVAAAVAHYRAKGVEFGLHSSCYTEDDYIGALRREIERFAECFGFRPTSFTVHGLGSFRAEIRDRFAEEIVDRLAEFGFVFTDCNIRMRQYHYVISDCHFDAATGRRYICDDMVSLPRFFEPGRDYLVLTHPCYWR